MAREAYYFTHDSNARHDPKMSVLIRRHGVEGYGRYFMFVEMLRDEADYKLALSDDTMDAIAIQTFCEPEAARAFLEDCIRIKLFISDGEFFWSESLHRRMKRRADEYEKKSKAGKSGGKKKAESTHESSRSLADSKQSPSRSLADSKQSPSSAVAIELNRIELNRKEENGIPPTPTGVSDAAHALPGTGGEPDPKPQAPAGLPKPMRIVGSGESQCFPGESRTAGTPEAIAAMEAAMRRNPMLARRLDRREQEAPEAESAKEEVTTP